ncbi:hypothetical protein Ptr902_07274 [Pyrenophora tritici-repentis]|nr:hypothetical protein Ptr902_07274 [Pyrenophora tritici-repentis]
MEDLQQVEKLESHLHRLVDKTRKKRDSVDELRHQLRRATNEAMQYQRECSKHAIYYSRSQCLHLANLMQQKLPAELRDMIYEFLVVEDRPIYVGPYYHLRTYHGHNLNPPPPDELSPEEELIVRELVRNAPPIRWESTRTYQRLKNTEALDVDSDGVSPELTERIRKLDLTYSNECTNQNGGQITLPDGRVKQVHTYHPPEDMVLPSSYLLNPRYFGPAMSAEIQKVYYTQNTFSICSIEQAIRNFGTLHSGYYMQTWEKDGRPREVPDDLKLQPLFYPVNHVRDLQIRVKCEQYQPNVYDPCAYENLQLFLRQIWSNISKLDLFVGRGLPFGTRIEIVLMTQFGDLGDDDNRMYAECAYVNFLQCIRNMVYKLMYDHDDVCVTVTHHDEHNLPLQLAPDITGVFALTKERWEYEKSFRRGLGDDVDKFYVVPAWRDQEREEFVHGYDFDEIGQYIRERWGLEDAFDRATTHEIREGRYWPRPVQADRGA